MMPAPFNGDLRLRVIWFVHVHLHSVIEVVLTSEVIVVFFSICILFHLAAEFNLCERSIFCHHFAVGNNKTVRDKFRMFVELVLVSYSTRCLP